MSTDILIREGTVYHTLEHLIERIGKEKLKSQLRNEHYVIGIDVNLKEKLLKKGFAKSAISAAKCNMKRGKAMNHLEKDTGRVKSKYYGKNIYSTIDTSAAIIEKAEEKMWANNKVKQHKPYPNMLFARGADFLSNGYRRQSPVSEDKKNN